MSKFFLIIILFLISTLPLSAKAEQGSWQSSDQLRARIISALDDLGGAASFEGGIEIQMSEGWHTYWKMPGDAGLPPRFDWSASENIKNVQILFPAPERKNEMDVQVFGYTDMVLFPVIVSLENPSQPANLRIALNIMVCKEMCIPQEVNLDLSLQNAHSAKTDMTSRSMIDAAKRKLPKTEDSEALKTTTTVIGKDALAVGVYSKAGFDHADIIAYSDDLFLTIAPHVEVDAKDKNSAILSLKKPEGTEDLNAALAGKTLHLLITDGRNALEKDIKF